MKRLRNLGINLLGARNTALQSLVVEAAPPLVAELLGYSYNVTKLHAEIAAQPWAVYVTSRKPAAAQQTAHGPALSFRTHSPCADRRIGTQPDSRAPQTIGHRHTLTNTAGSNTEGYRQIAAYHLPCCAPSVFV
jgi:predicted component of type VI protein secretion system